MPPSVTKLEPWIEKLILSYGTEQQTTKCRRLKAHVVGVGQMAPSQQQAQGQGAQGGPTDLLFLSDGVVQIPALLTASAWEDLQEREERDCLSSLANTTVCVQSYCLQFHMNPEQTRCRFFVSVGKLATVAAGPPNDITPSCTTLAPVRQQICKTWGSLLPDLPHHGSSASQNTQCSFDLSNLLGAWQHDAMNSVLDCVQNALRVAPPCPVSSSQPSTSSCNPPTTSHHADTYTGWDADRTRYKSEEQFSIPACHLLMPEEEAQRRPQTAFEQESETPSGILNPPEDTITDLPNTVQPILGHFNTNAFPPEILERGSLGSEDTLSRDDVLNEDTITESNPWDAFSPPFAMLTTSSSCSGESITSEAIPPKALTDTTGITLQLEGVPLVASTQMSTKGSSETSQTSDEQSYGIPPYQKPRSTPRLGPVSNSSSSASGSATEPVGRNLLLNRGSSLLVSNQENLQVEEEMETGKGVAQRKRRTVKRKINHSRSSDTSTALEGKEEGVPSSWSPPSWLFETQRASRAEVRSPLKQTKSMGTASGAHSTVHSDGTQFSYKYTGHSGQLLQDLSKFKVVDDMLHWAVQYLTVPKQTDIAHNLVSEQ